MKYIAELPFAAIRDPQAWTAGRSLTEWAVAVEAAGFDAVAVTDHPFPSDAWLSNGGHHAFDPFVILTAFGVATSTIRLISDVLVAGYRNPYLVAKSMASVDQLTNGRLTLGIAAGYQRAEFDALGASFEDRGGRFDEAISAITAALSGQSVHSDGPHYPAHGHTALPRPTQLPRPPIWVGGNAPAALRRAVRLADGWMPFHQSTHRVAISLAPSLESLEELAPRIATAQAQRADLGLAPLEICVSIFQHPLAPEDYRALAPVYAEAGVTWIRVMTAASSMATSIPRLQSIAAALELATA